MCQSVTDRDGGAANPPNVEALGVDGALLMPPAPAADGKADEVEMDVGSDGAFAVDDDDDDDEGARGGFELAPVPAPADETDRSGSALAEIADDREDDEDEAEDDALPLPPTERAVAALFAASGVSS